MRKLRKTIFAKFLIFSRNFSFAGNIPLQTVKLMQSQFENAMQRIRTPLIKSDLK